MASPTPTGTKVGGNVVRFISVTFISICILAWSGLFIRGCANTPRGTGEKPDPEKVSPHLEVHHVMVPVAPAWSEPIPIPAHYNICPSSGDPTVGSVRSRLYHNGEVVKEYEHHFGAKDGFEFDGIAYQSVTDKPFRLDYVLTDRP